MSKIYVKDLLKSAPPALGLVLAAGSGDARKRPVYPDFQKVGLALAGHFEDIDPHKVQVLGRTEISYLKKLTPARRKRAVEGLMGRRASAYIVTSGGSPPEEMLRLADELKLPVLTCPLDTVRCIRGVLKALDELASGGIHVHGVLVDIMGVGVLILGASGIGKSECAIELVVRGHRLVADDIVVVKKLSDGRLVGSGAEMIRYLVEVRGIGIVNVKDLFGISSIKSKKTIDMVVELVQWNEKESYERLGLDEKTYTMEGVKLPYMKMPVTPGRNIAVIVEVAARNQALRAQGANAAEDLDKRLSRKIASETTGANGEEY